VLIKLRESNLLRKEDIRQYDLLYHSSFEPMKMRFEYLVDWNPQVLKEDGDNHALILDVLLNESCARIDCFAGGNNTLSR